MDSSKLLRLVTGGHKEEISILQYNDYLSLIATGSIDGEVCIWDFELSKLEALLSQVHTSDITGIEFVAPFPLMITASMDCTVALWAVRPAPLALRYVCLSRLANNSWNFDHDTVCPISKILLVHRTMPGIKNI
jgi:hypothetical protein